MSSLKLMCEEFFGSTNFYEILKVNTNASERELKKAYHKLSLLVHPDRVDDDKVIATKKFQVLGKIHSILQDKEKRKLYDDIGEFDEEDDSSFNWMDYWRSLFKKIEIKDIENYEKKYIGSEMELRDIKKAYESSKGNMDEILEMVPFSNCDSESRIMEVVEKMVDNGEVQKYKSFFNENKEKKHRRHKKWAKEKKESELVDMKELEKHVERNMKQREETFGRFMEDIQLKYDTKKKRKSVTDGSLVNKRKKAK